MIESPESPLRQRRRAQTRIEIARAALQLFLEKGFDAVTAAEIAARSGVSRATFFNYFPRKELILAEFARSRAERVERLLESHPRLRPARLVELFSGFGRENESQLMSARALIPPLAARPCVQDAVRPLQERVISRIASALAASGSLRAGVAPRTFAETFFAVYKATMLEWAVHPAPPKGWQARTLRRRLSLLASLATIEEFL